MLHVLIVDDEPLARERLHNLLNRMKMSIFVEEVGNGKDAIAMINHNPPDIVFLDIEIPDKNGFEVLECIRHDEKPRIVFVTAYQKYTSQINEIADSQYLLKPFDEQKFKRVFHDLVQTDQ